MDCTPEIRAKLIEVKTDGDLRRLATIKADLEEMQRLDAEPDPEGVEAIDRAMKALNAATRTLENITKIAEKSFKSFVAGTDEPDGGEGSNESDRALSAEQVGLELGLNEETVNLLLTHHGFQTRQPLNETYPLLCSYHPTPLGIVFCRDLMVIRCTAEPRFYYRPLWQPGIVDALKNKIEP
jgi:hypothetical protein